MERRRALFPLFVAIIILVVSIAAGTSFLLYTGVAQKQIESVFMPGKLQITAISAKDDKLVMSVQNFGETDVKINGVILLDGNSPVVHLPANITVKKDSIAMLNFTILNGSLEREKRYEVKVLCNGGASATSMVKGLRFVEEGWKVEWHRLIDRKTGEYDANVTRTEIWHTIDIMVCPEDDADGVFIAKAKIYFASSETTVSILGYSGIQVYIDGSLVLASPWRYNNGLMDEPKEKAVMVTPGYHDVEVRAISTDIDLHKTVLVSFTNAWWRLPSSDGEWRVKWYKMQPKWKFVTDQEWKDLNFGKLWGAKSTPAVVDYVYFRANARLYFPKDSLAITTAHDDGIAIYIDGVQILLSWSQSAYKKDVLFVKVKPGYHNVTITWYRSKGNGLAMVDLEGVEWAKP